VNLPGGAVSREDISEDLSDVSVVPAPLKFIEGWRGGEMEKNIEKFGVLAVLCDGEEKDTKGPTFAIMTAAKLTGVVVEADNGKGEWYTGTVLGPVWGGPGRLRILWSADGSVSEVYQNQIRKAKKVALFGPIENRLKAELQLLHEIEESGAQGLSIAHASQRAPPRTLGIEAPLEARIGRRTHSMMANHEEGGHMVALLAATGCKHVIFSKQPREPRFDKHEFRTLLAGTQEQRWLAGNILQFSALARDLAKNEPVPSVPPPPHLLGELVTVNVPSDLMGAVIGPKGIKLRELQIEFGCIIIPYRTFKGEGKREASEEDDLLEMMFQHVRHGANQEVVIFGPVRSRYAAKLRLLKMIETKYNGYFQKPEGDDPAEVDPSVGMGVDKIWLSTDFEPDAGNERGKILGAATRCSVEAAGKLVFISGVKTERRRCKEYLRWVVAWSSMKRNKKYLPHVEHAAFRKDVLLLDVQPMKIWGDKWVRDQMWKMSERRKVWAFFDDWVPPATGEEGGIIDDRRMVIASAEIERHGVESEFAAELRRESRQIVKDLEEWVRDGGKSWWQRQQEKKEKELKSKPVEPEPVSDLPPLSSPNAFAGNLPTPATPAMPLGMALPQTPAGNIPMPATPMPGAGIRPPATPAPGGGVPPPATPGMPAFGVRPPATPMFGAGVAPPATPMHGAGVRPPATPGAGGVAPPATPMVGAGIRPPATPALGGVAPPATPGVGGVAPPGTPMVGGVAPPATPMLGAAVRPPATPAVGGAAPPATPMHGAGIQPPATPGAGGLAPPATPGSPGFLAPPATPGGGFAPPGTPGGFGPHGSSAPCTPALGGRMLPPPSTPGGFGPHALAAPSTPAPGGGMAPPQTPGGFGPHALAAPSTPMPTCGQGLRPPATPGGMQQNSFSGPDRHQAELYSALADHDDDWLPPMPTKRPAPGSLNEPASKRAAPQTPAGLGIGATPQKSEAHPAGQPSRAAPQTPAMLGMAPVAMSSASSALPNSRAAPQTPAGLGEPMASRPRSSPSTPPKAAGRPAPTPAAVAKPGQPPPAKAGAGKLLTFSSVLKVGSSGGSVLGAPPPKAAKVISSFRILREGEPPKEEEEELPPGWEKKVSKSNGKSYYWNAKLVKSQYHRPTA